MHAFRECQPLLFAVVETHLQTGEALPVINDYASLRQDRDVGKTLLQRGGGIALWYRADLDVVVEAGYQGTDMEALAVKYGTARVVVIYRRPKASRHLSAAGERFLESTIRADTVVLGDLNFDPREPDAGQPALASVLRDEYNLVQQVRFATREARILDHVWARTRRTVRRVPQLDGVSDHRAVGICGRGPDPPPRQENWTGYIWRMDGVRPPALPGEATPRLCDLLDGWGAWWEARRRKKRLQEVNDDLPWLTKAAVSALRATTRAAAKCRADPTDATRERLREARRRSRRACADALGAYIRKVWEKHKLTRGGFRVYRALLGRRRAVKCEPCGTPEEVSRAFQEKDAALRKSAGAPLSPAPLVTPDPLPPPFVFRAVEGVDVLHAMTRTSSTRALGHDLLPMKVIKAAKAWAATWVASIASAVIRESLWPDGWKKALVYPLWKGEGDKTAVQQYRRVSLLTALSRLVEKVLVSQLQPHVEKWILPAGQHGFRTGHSVATAVASVVDCIARARDRGKIALVLSVDVAGAFDSVVHARLLDKLAMLKLDATVLDLLTSYLRGRTQSVRMTTGGSSWAAIEAGVPQGSVLGPLLYSIYTWDMHRFVTEATVFLYADDTLLIVEADTLEEGLERMRRAVAQLKSYCVDNGLVLSPRPTKTQFMVVPARLVVEGEVFDFGGVSAPVKNVLKYLGFLLDAGLTGTPQARAVIGRVTGVARNVARRLRGLKVADMGLIMAALTHSLLNFGTVALPNPAAEATNLMQKAYDRTARFAADRRALVVGIPWDRKLSNEESRTRLRWPPWAERIRALTRCFVAKIWETGQPAALRRLLPAADGDPESILRSSRLRGRREIQTISVRTAMGRKAFGYWAAEVLSEVRATCPPVYQEPAFDEHTPMPTFPFRREEPAHQAYLGFLRDKFARQDEIRSAGHVVVWTDGSRIESEGRVRAGGGVFYCPGSARNVAVPAGGVRSAQRAELAAFLAALLADSRRLEIRSDSRYVVEGVNRDLPQWRGRAWFKSPARAMYISNADLWFQVEKELSSERDPVRVVWVPGHGTLQKVSAGEVTELDVWGNAGADWIAQWAARHCNSMHLGCRHAWHG